MQFGQVEEHDRNVVCCIQGAAGQGQQAFQQQLPGRGMMVGGGRMSQQLDPSVAEMVRNRAAGGGLMAGLIPSLASQPPHAFGPASTYHNLYTVCICQNATTRRT